MAEFILRQRILAAKNEVSELQRQYLQVQWKDFCLSRSSR